MTTPIRGNPRPLSVTNEPTSPPVQSHTPRTTSREPDVIEDHQPGIPAYLRRTPEPTSTPTLSCVEATVISPDEAQRNLEASRSEIQTLAGVALDMFEQSLQRVAHEARACSATATVSVRLPSGQDCRISMNQLATMQRTVSEQRGWLRMVSEIRSANDRTIGPLAAAVQLAEQQRTGAESSLCITLPSGGRAQLSTSDARVVHRLLEAQANVLGQQDVRRQLDASRLRNEIYRGAALTLPVLGSAIGVAECINHRSITGRSVSQTECILAVAAASIELAALGYQGARVLATIARTEELAIATVNSGVRLEDVWRAVRQMTPQERELVRHLVSEMRANARTVTAAGDPAVEILRQSELTQAVELLTRRGITRSPHSPSVLEVGAEARRVGERGMSEAFPELAAEPRYGAQDTHWVSAMTTTEHGTVELAAGVGGTSTHGTIFVSPRGTFNDRMRAVLHERVHQFLRARLSERGPIAGQLATWFNQAQSAHYGSSVLRRYLEEALAEAHALARTDADDWLGAAAEFPLTEDYRITLTAIGRGDVAAAGVVIGTGVAAGFAVHHERDLGICTVGNRQYRVDLQRIGTPLERQERAESRQERQSQQEIDAMVRARSEGGRR